MGLTRAVAPFAILLAVRAAIAACSGSSIPVENCGATGGAKATPAQRTQGSNVLTGPVGTWTSGDVGKIIWCVQIDAASTDGLTTVTGFTDSSHITIGLTAQQSINAAWCVWGTQDDTTAFEAANAAGTPSGDSTVLFGSFGGPASTITFCGGYIISGTVFEHLTNGPSPSFKGCDVQSAILFLSPSTDLTLPAVVMVGPGGEIGGFTISGMGLGFVGSGALRLAQASNFNLHDVSIRRLCTDTGPALDINNSSYGRITNVTVQDMAGATLDGTPCTQTACSFDTDGAINVDGALCSNFYRNLSVTGNSGARGPGGAPLNFNGCVIDECLATPSATAGCTTLASGGYADFQETSFYSPAGSPAITVDPTSKAWISRGNVGPFIGNETGSALYVAPGGRVVASDTTWRAGSQAAAAIAMFGTFVDVGGNDYLRCFDTTCSQVGYTDGFSNAIQTAITAQLSTWGVLQPR